jgi:hypothetical protein
MFARLIVSQKKKCFNASNRLAGNIPFLFVRAKLFACVINTGC